MLTTPPGSPRPRSRPSTKSWPSKTRCSFGRAECSCIGIRRAAPSRRWPASWGSGPALLSAQAAWRGAHRRARCVACVVVSAVSVSRDTAAVRAIAAPLVGDIVGALVDVIGGRAYALAVAWIATAAVYLVSTWGVVVPLNFGAHENACHTGRSDIHRRRSDEQMASPPLTRHHFHGEWNYTLQPK